MQEERKQTARRAVLSSTKKALLTGTVALAVVAFVGAVGPFNTQVPPANAQSAETMRSAAPFSFADVVEAVGPAVVSVRVRQNVQTNGDRRHSWRGEIPEFRDLPEDHPFNRFFRRFEREFGERPNRPFPRGPRRFGMGQGSGFIISEDGYLVTNHHVIENASEITVVVNGGDEYEAELIGADERTDLALLKIEGNSTFEFVEFAEDDDVRVGDWVVTMGNPFGLGGTVTAGIVSARGREIGSGPYDDFLQIDAAVNRGNSGGPAFNLNGEVIGVNTAIFSPTGGNVGIAFAIPASIARDVVADLREDGSVTRGWLGVSIQPVTGDIAESIGLDDADGALVSEVTDDSPAEEAGVEVGDAIVEVNGERINSPRDLARTIAALDPNARAELTVWRDGRERDLTVRIGELPSQMAALGRTPAPVERRSADIDGLGLSLSFAGNGEEGVLITEVDPGSEAGERGLRRGDRILQVAGSDVSSPNDVAEALTEAAESGRRTVLLLVESRDRTRFVAVNVDRS